MALQLYLLPFIPLLLFFTGPHWAGLHASGLQGLGKHLPGKHMSGPHEAGLHESPGMQRLGAQVAAKAGWLTANEARISGKARPEAFMNMRRATISSVAAGPSGSVSTAGPASTVPVLSGFVSVFIVTLTNPLHAV
jgi:hypothetical protein